MLKSDEKKETFSRRRFLKTSATVGVGAAIATIPNVNNSNNTSAYAKTILTKEQDEFPLEVSSDYQRYNCCDHCFNRAGRGDPACSEYPKYLKLLLGKGEYPGGPGLTQVDYSLARAAYSTEIDFAYRSTMGVPGFLYDNSIYKWDGPIYEKKATFDNKKEAAKIIKKAAKILDADLVGIASFDERWLYSKWVDITLNEYIPVELPFEPKSVIVMAFEMDYECYKTAPSAITDAASTNGYSRMAVTCQKMAQFVRGLGYQAIPCGNDTCLNIPIAIQAGLGELGRNGLLITEEYGPRVRIAKIFTDLELEKDKPITFGVYEFCKNCMKCADNCPSQAIEKTDDRSYNVLNSSNQPGVKKWFVHPEKCVNFMGESRTLCGYCITVCPYNKIQDWHHDLSRLATVIPGVKNVAREFDELFGYGKTYNEKVTSEFWENIDE